MRSPSAWRAAASLALVCVALAGCGGEISTPERLARLADDVAAAATAGDGCKAGEAARKLQRAVIRAVNRRELPAEELEGILGDANELAATLDCGLMPTPHDAELARGLARRLRGG